MGHVLKRLKRGACRLILLLRLPKNSIGAEIGVWRGSFTQHIRRLVRPVSLHLIDPWVFDPNAELYCESQKKYDAVYDEICVKFKHEIDRGHFFIHRTFSEKAAAVFSDNYFDWVYIDGDHRYEEALRDLRIYYEKVRAGGFIAGDDYRRSDDPMIGVKRAVDEFILEGNVEKVLILGDQYLLKKSSKVCSPSEKQAGIKQKNTRF